MIRSEIRRKRPKFETFPVKFPVSREFDPETGSPLTVSSASYYVPDIAYIIVFLGSLFSGVFAGVTGLVFKANDYVIVGAGSAGCVVDRTARSAFMRTSTPVVGNGTVRASTDESAR